MRELYVIEDTEPISVIPLSTTSGTTVHAVWKNKELSWYVTEPGRENNVIDVLTPHQFDEAIQNGKYSLNW
jgi:hypothetical protein